MRLESSYDRNCKLVNFGYSILVSNKKEAIKLVDEILINIRSSFRGFIDLIEISFCIQCQKEMYLKLRFEEMQNNNQDLNIKFYWGGIKGVAKSRNLLIENSCSSYIHFLDSDCIFNNSESAKYFRILKNCNDKLIFFVSSNSDFQERKSVFSIIYKIFPSLFKNKIILFLKYASSAATYNIIVNLNLLKKFKNIRFDENLGLGSKFQQSDEILFLLNLYKYLPKKSFSIMRCNSFKAISKSHLPKNSKIDLILKSKGYVLRRTFGNKGIILLIPLSIIFYFKYKSHINFINLFFNIYEGFQYICRSQ